jgi:pilus assembly protein CpaF
MTEQAARFLDACVTAGLNVLVCGGTQAGKTTLLNALCATVPARERVVTVEEVFEHEDKCRRGLHVPHAALATW